MWTWGPLVLVLPWDMRSERLSSSCIVLCGDRVPEESEDPKGARVRRATR